MKHAGVDVTVSLSSSTAFSSCCIVLVGTDMASFYELGLALIEPPNGSWITTGLFWNQRYRFIYPFVLVLGFGAEDHILDSDLGNLKLHHSVVSVLEPSDPNLYLFGALRHQKISLRLPRDPVSNHAERCCEHDMLLSYFVVIVLQGQRSPPNRQDRSSIVAEVRVITQPVVQPAPVELRARGQRVLL